MMHYICASMTRSPALATLAILVALAVAAGAPRAEADSSSKCSETGDICVDAFKRSGRVYLRIGLSAQYFDTYRLCVTPPRGTRECKRFAIGPQNGAPGDTVRWSAQFTNRGAGTYRARWIWGDGPGNMSVTFRR